MCVCIHVCVVSWSERDIVDGDDGRCKEHESDGDIGQDGWRTGEALAFVECGNYAFRQGYFVVAEDVNTSSRKIRWAADTPLKEANGKVLVSTCG